MRYDAHGVGGMFSEEIELPFKVPLFKGTILRGIPVAKVVAKHDKRLQDSRFFAFGGRAKNGPVGGNRTPTQDTETELGGHFSEGVLLFLALDFILGVEEDIANGVLAGLGKRATQIHLDFALEKRVGNAGHDAGAVAIAAIGAHGASMGHVAEERSGIGHDFMTGLALDLANEANTTGIAVVFVVVEALFRRERGGPGVQIALYVVESIQGGLEIVGKRRRWVIEGLGAHTRVHIKGGGLCGARRRQSVERGKESHREQVQPLYRIGRATPIGSQSQATALRHVPRPNISERA